MFTNNQGIKAYRIHSNCPCTPILIESEEQFKSYLSSLTSKCKQCGKKVKHTIEDIK